jgi:hypothetical protein
MAAQRTGEASKKEACFHVESRALLMGHVLPFKTE